MPWPRLVSRWESRDSNPGLLCKDGMRWGGGGQGLTRAVDHSAPFFPQAGGRGPSRPVPGGGRGHSPARAPLQPACAAAGAAATPTPTGAGEAGPADGAYVAWAPGPSTPVAADPHSSQGSPHPAPPGGSPSLLAPPWRLGGWV